VRTEAWPSTAQCSTTQHSTAIMPTARHSTANAAAQWHISSWAAYTGLACGARSASSVLGSSRAGSNRPIPAAQRMGRSYLLTHSVVQLKYVD
jgi:hypothetical protein